MPVVGSSKKIKMGLVNNSTPIETRFFSPPEIPRMKIFPILVSAHSTKPRSLINFSTYPISFNFKSDFLFFTLIFRSYLGSFNLNAAVKLNDSKINKKKKYFIQ